MFITRHYMKKLFVSVFALLLAVMLTACGRKGPDAPTNTMPDVFSFTAQTNVTPNTVVTSNSITVSGINTATQISIIGGEYSIDGGAYTSAVGMVTNGQMVTVRQTSSVNFGTMTNAVLTIGGISGIFSVTTIVTTTTTTISAPAVTYGANGSVTVTVSSVAGIPGGNVLLSVDGTLILQPLSGGSTNFTISRPDAGNHTLSATYIAQGYYQGSSASGTLNVGQAVTTTTISTAAVTYGTNGSVTVTVSSVAGIPGGSVSLSVDNGTPMTQTLSSGSATFTIPMPSAGIHTLSAVYTAQGNFGASSASGTLIVN
jgi:predicted small lipoprotein YifL